MIGRTLGRYRVVERLGAGGMGVVYRAHDDHLQRDVALKVLAPGTIVGRTSRALLHKEARALSRLNHPNIATVHDFDSDGDIDFLVMEHIPGTTLTDRLAAGPLAGGEIAGLGLQIASALEEAHEKGIIHRDLKPGNIMLTPKGQVKVLDFGLAKLLRPDVALATTQSASSEHALAGTLAYMAPEQLNGAVPDPRADIHAVGAVLYEMATGHLPFSGDTLPALINAILHRQPVAPSALNPEVPSSLEGIILKCLEKAPGGRYQSARELATDLRRANSGADATPLPTIERRTARTWSARLLLAGAATALVVLSVTRWLPDRAPILMAKDIVLLIDFQNLTPDPTLGGAMLRDALAFKLLESPFLNVYPPEDVKEALRLMERAADSRLDEKLGREICLRQGLKALVVGSIAALGKTYVIQLKAVEARSGATLASEQTEVESKEKVVHQLGMAAAALRKKLGESLPAVHRFDVPLEQATTSSLDALQAFSAGAEATDFGHFAEALVHFKRATEIDPGFAVAYARLAESYGNDNQVALMRATAKKAYDLRGQTSERERLLIEFTYHASVTEDARRALEVARLQAQMYPRDVRAHYNAGRYCRTLGQYDEAIDHFEESLRLSPRTAGRAYASLGWTYQFLNRFDDAEAYGRRALAAGYESVGVRQLLYLLGAMRGEAAAMDEQIHELVADPQEYLAGRWQGDRAAFSGQFAAARAFYADAAEAAERRGLTNRVAIEMAWGTRMDAQAGVCREAATRTGRALSRSREANVLRDSIHALAECGQIAWAESLLLDLARSRPESTYVNEILVPDLQSLIDIQRGEYRKALARLQTLVRYDRTSVGVGPIYLRGVAHLALGDAPAAAAEFQAIVDHRGLDALSIYFPLAHLQMGRTAALGGDLPKARKFYETFLGLWKDADAGVPILDEARAEYARLKAIPER